VVGGHVMRLCVRVGRGGVHATVCVQGGMWCVCVRAWGGGDVM
jgi:hypothetical protein